MKRKSSISLSLLLVMASIVVISAFSQPNEEWSRTFGGTKGDSGNSVQQTSDGGYIIAGRTASFGAGRRDMYLVKTDSDGTLVWEKTFGGSQEERGFSAQQTSDGGYIIAGWTMSFSYVQGQVYLVKTDSAGNMLWDRTFGGTMGAGGYSVQQTSDGGYIIAGELAHDVYLVKTDSDGTLLWEKTFGGTKSETGYSVQETSDGGYIIAGFTRSLGAADPDMYLVKTDSDGTLVWEKTFGGSEYEIGYSVQQTSDGGYIIAGRTASFGAGSHDMYLVKTDSDGTLVWEKTFGGSGPDDCFSVQQTSDGGYIIAGAIWHLGAGKDDVYLVKTDAYGTLVWEKTFGGTESEGGYSVQQTSDGGYIVVGYTTSYGAGDVDVYLIKVASLARASVSGYILYNDEPVTQYTNLMPSFFVRDEVTGEGVDPLSFTYNNDNGYYQIFDLPPGKYGVEVFIDAAEPYNTEHGFPDDYEGWKSPIITEEDITVTQDLVVRKVIHLTLPVDNIEEVGHIGDEKDTYDSSPLFTWEPITEASWYYFNIGIYSEVSPGGYIGEAYSTTTTLTSLQPGLPLTEENEFYLCDIYAYNDAGTLVGILIVSYDNGHGWDYRFKIGIPSPEDQIEEIIDFFEEYVSNGDIVGDGPGKSAKGRLKALGNMLREAETLILEGFYDEAYLQLMDVYRRCDGIPRPPDFVGGDSADELANMIFALLENLE